MSNDDNNFPPNWMRHDVETALHAAVQGRLHLVETHPTHYGWLLDEPAPAHPIAPEVSETTACLIQNGHLIWGGRRTLTTESGEMLTADQIEITSAGRELLDRLNPGR